MAEHVVFRGPRRALVPLIRRALAGVTGRGPDAAGIARGVLLRGGIALLSKIQTSFLLLSRGGASEAGYVWDALSPRTIAGRRTTRAELKSLGITGKRVRGFLTGSEDAKWRQVFGTRLARFLATGMNPAAAKARAAQVAWAVVKAAGARTKLQVLGGRKVDLGRDSGALFRSLTPGYEDVPSGAPDQVLTADPGRIVVGSNRPYAARFHARRPLWPRGNPATLPPTWNAAVAAAVARGLIGAVTRVLERGGV